MNETTLLVPTAGAMPTSDSGAVSRLGIEQKPSNGDRFSGMLREQRLVAESGAVVKPTGNQSGRLGGEISPPPGNDLPESSSSSTANTDIGGAAAQVAGAEPAPLVTELPFVFGGSSLERKRAPAGLTLAAAVAQPQVSGLPIAPKVLEAARPQVPIPASTQSRTAVQLSQTERPEVASRGPSGVAVNGAPISATMFSGRGRADTPSPAGASLASFPGSAPSGEAVSVGARPLSASAQLTLARAGLFTAEGAANRIRTGAAPSISSVTRPPPGGLVLTNPVPPPTTQPSSSQGVPQQGIGHSLFKLVGTTDFVGLTATSRELSTGGEFSSVLQSSLVAAAPKPTGVPVLNVATFAGQPGWSNELGQRVSWMVGHQLREAQLQLHPRSLGPVEVRIAFGPEQQLMVNFSAANGVAREALEAALPRLREMFDQQGLNLGQADVSRESFAEQRRRAQEDSLAAATEAADAETLADGSLASHPAGLVVNMAEGLLDAYA